MSLPLEKSRKNDGAAIGPRPARYSITSIDIVVQIMFTLVVFLRLFMGWDFTLEALMWLAMATIYVAPAAAAVWRGHPARASIIAVNLLSGWTGVGWVVAFLWSTRRHDRRAPAL